MRSVDRLQIPAFSVPFLEGEISGVCLGIPSESLTREWAMGGSTGKGVRIAILDSGVDAKHPNVGVVNGYATVQLSGADVSIVEEPHDDLYGHGTACAGIIRNIAPDCEIYSVRVLTSNLSGGFNALIAGLKWAVDNGMDACNLSLGTTRKDFFAVLHDIADRAFFRKMNLVVAANNQPVPSYPAMFASVISVASHDLDDAKVIYANPRPPVDFGAYGCRVRVPWLDQSYSTVTGNSYAAPHVTGTVARILSKHPNLTPLELRLALRSICQNASLPTAIGTDAMQLPD